jgi:hypothetical protein
LNIADLIQNGQREYLPDTGDGFKQIISSGVLLLGLFFNKPFNFA